MKTQPDRFMSLVFYFVSFKPFGYIYQRQIVITNPDKEMKLTTISIKKSLNKAYQKQRVTRYQIELFKSNLHKLFSRINEEESEEHLKNIVADFLKDTYYKDIHYINTRDRADLVLHTGKNPSDSVGVIIETKKPSNKLEMVAKKDANVKALHELVLYYLRESLDSNNHEIKYLIATNICEWFIFDAVWFEKNVFRNTKLVKDYEQWKLTGHDTKYFYERVAAKHLEAIEAELFCTYFNLKEFEDKLDQKNTEEDVKLVDLYKAFSPEYLLKKPFANDSNSLNKEFYNELLHIIGLCERREGSKKVIDRQPEGVRSEGTLIENTINILKVRDKLAHIDNTNQYGETEYEQLFSVALELCITWLNRILFLKLLEGQLILYHKGDGQYSFLNIKRTSNYDELNSLFFEVLALPEEKRSVSVKKQFGDLPYLNSSLFEETSLEVNAFPISELKGHFEIPIYSSTILKATNGKRIAGTKNTLEYLFEFLDAYDFSSEGKDLIQEQNKSIINASVLGLIFEKINGYKDGSYFTPGFITMYMCRETLRKAVVKKFQDSGIKAYQNIETFDDLKDAIECKEKEPRAKANEIINSIKVCDPAVGSGHFLVSALNELIAIKSDLQILSDRNGMRLRGYKIVVENDELIILNEETDELFEYTLNKNNKPIEELQILQEALFHEKQTLIENCLFGVDINPKSVMICRLRLWIELLKNAYYTKESKYQHLETLPNIDINIKCGNSLISRFDVQDDYHKLSPFTHQKIREATRKYKDQVILYKCTDDKKVKQQAEKTIARLKEEFSSITNPLDKDYQLLKNREAALLEKQGGLFATNNREDWGKEINTLAEQYHSLKTRYEEKKGVLYGNAFEWRFEFPEVLDDDGKFLGFDVVIGNPPYGVQYTSSEKDFFAKTYHTIDDIYTIFIEKGVQLIKEVGSVSLIIPIFWLTGEKYYATRKFISERSHLELGITLPYDIFLDAYVDTGIYSFLKKKSVMASNIYEFNPREKVDYGILNSISLSTLRQDEWSNNPEMKLVFDPTTRILNNRINRFVTKIEDVTESARGILANSEDYSNSKTDISCEPVFTGKLDRYLIEKNNFQYIAYNDSLKEKPTSFDFFTGERILIRRIISRQFRIMATLTNRRFVVKKDIYIFKNNQKKYSHKYLLALINSRLISFLKTKSSTSAKKDDFTQLTLNDIRQISLPDISKAQNTKLEKLVDKILEKKQKSPIADTSALEKQIDAMVYELYGLTEEEIRIVEKNC